MRKDATSIMGIFRSRQLVGLAKRSHSHWLVAALSTRFARLEVIVRCQGNKSPSTSINQSINNALWVEIEIHGDLDRGTKREQVCRDWIF